MVRIVRAGTTARRVAAALPVVALASAGIAFAATRGPDVVTPTSITVPDEAIQEGSPVYPQAGPAPAPRVRRAHPGTPRPRGGRRRGRSRGR